MQAAEPALFSLYYLVIAERLLVSVLPFLSSAVPGLGLFRSYTDVAMAFLDPPQPRPTLAAWQASLVAVNCWQQAALNRTRPWAPW